MSDTYKMDARCTNCKERWRVDILMGIDGSSFEMMQTCKHCGCKTVVVEAIR